MESSVPSGSASFSGSNIDQERPADTDKIENHDNPALSITPGDNFPSGMSISLHSAYASEDGKETNHAIWSSTELSLQLGIASDEENPTTVSLALDEAAEVGNVGINTPGSIDTDVRNQPNDVGSPLPSTRPKQIAQPMKLGSCEGGCDDINDGETVPKEEDGANKSPTIYNITNNYYYTQIGNYNTIVNSTQPTESESTPEYCEEES